MVAGRQPSHFPLLHSTRPERLDRYTLDHIGPYRPLGTPASFATLALAARTTIRPDVIVAEQSGRSRSGLGSLFVLAETRAVGQH
jgi:hypothetical protein